MVTNVAYAPQTKLILYSEHAKIYEVELEPGERTYLHPHREDYMVYSFGDARIRMTTEDGRSEDMELKASTAFARQAEIHTVENTGDSKSRFLIIEFNEHSP